MRKSFLTYKSLIAALTLGLVFSLLASWMEPKAVGATIIIAAALGGIAGFSLAIYLLAQRGKDIATLSWRGLALIIGSLAGNPLQRIFQVAVSEPALANIAISLTQIVASIFGLAAIIVTFHRNQNRES